MYKALSIRKIRQKYKNADIIQDTLLSSAGHSFGGLGSTGVLDGIKNAGTGALIIELRIFSIIFRINDSQSFYLEIRIVEYLA